MLDLSKPVQTRDGRKARIITTDRKGIGTSVIALVMSPDGEESIYALYPNGQFRSIYALYSNGRFSQEYESPGDLVNAAEQTVRYLNIWQDVGGGIAQYYHPTEEAARGVTGPNRRLGVLKMILEDGIPVSSEILPA